MYNMTTPQPEEPSEELIEAALDYAAWDTGKLPGLPARIKRLRMLSGNNSSHPSFIALKILASAYRDRVNERNAEADGLTVVSAAFAASRRDALRFQELNEVYGKSRDSRGYEMNCVLHYGIKTLPELADMMLARSRHRVEMAAIDAAAKGASE